MNIRCDVVKISMGQKIYCLKEATGFYLNTKVFRPEATRWEMTEKAHARCQEHAPGIVDHIDAIQVISREEYLVREVMNS